MNISVKEQAVQMYKEGLKLKDISEATGLDPTYISKLAKAAGCEPRIKFKERHGDTTKHRCPKCKHIYTKGSNFCSNCGTDIRSKEKLLITDLEWLRGNLYWIHDDASRKKADTITRDIINYLSNKL